MVKAERTYDNNFSLIFGILCFVVVLIHSSWAEGFDIYSFGLESHLLVRVTSLIYMATVPTFFIMWGYLSSKYIYSDEAPLTFLKKKIAQFYPIFLVSFTINTIVRHDHILSLTEWKIFLSFLGMYYESGLWGGGHIFLVVLLVVGTISVFKLFSPGKGFVMGYCAACLVIAKVLPHDEQAVCYIKYFGYYSAFFLGAVLRDFGVFNGSIWKNGVKRMLPVHVIFIIGAVTPVLNMAGIKYLEIDYHPNSPEQLFMCVLMLYILNMVLERSRRIWGGSAVAGVFHKVGNNAYGHFIMQSHFIRFMVYLNGFIMLDRALLQLFIVLFTSCAVVYLLLPLYRRAESFVMAKI